MVSLSGIPHLGPKTIEKLNRLGIFSSQDLLYHFPHRYIDFSHCSKISDSVVNSNVTVTGTVIYFKNIFTRNHKNIQKAVIEDSSGQLDLIWFNQPYLSKNLVIGQKFSFAGTVSLYLNKKTIISPVYGQYNTGKIIAVYPETSGLNSTWFRKTISANLSALLPNKDPLPSFILKKYKLVDLSSALTQIHQPDNQSLLQKAKYRLGLDEILSLQSQSYLLRQSWESQTPAFTFKDFSKIDSFIKKLPFKLTASQINAWQEIKQDLLSSTPANRLLQGDVGSGKTIIALLSCLLAHLNRSTSLLIAPTEILAQQHFQTFSQLLKKLPIVLITGKTKHKNIPKGSIVIATHAAIYRQSSFKNHIGLLIIDEQHKFGVAQRSFLSKSLHPPHCLTMTATPIPRTISLTVLGNLNLSQLKELPSGRLPIKTFLVPQSKYSDCYRWLEEKINQSGQQAFIVCPFIEPSETLNSVKSAKQLFSHLQSSVFPKLTLGLVHGKTSTSDRQKIFQQYSQNKINILVTTPIIEVGIDFPNATTIIIQSADRFGLAQLHQLRGRVGRGADQSYCYLFTESDSEKAQKRLQMLTRTVDGQKIAEYDLQTRGPGEAFSVIQHGFPSLKIASYSDFELISLGQQIIKTLLDHQFALKKLVVAKAVVDIGSAN